MTLILDLTPEQEQQIENEARARNMDTPSMRWPGSLTEKILSNLRKSNGVGLT